METRAISILGSTGSVGTSTLKVVSQYPGRFRVAALAAGDNHAALAEQVRAFRPGLVAVRTEEGAGKVRAASGSPEGVRFVFGAQGARQAACHEEADIVVSAIVGAAGLDPTLAAVRAGKTVALANKEALVVAGPLVTREAGRHGARVLPVDSEHSAVFQALAGAPPDSVRRIILTASGGPFFRDPEKDLSRVTPEEALAHPNWKMGPKVTIDSATMMNKGLEIIEAHWLFALPGAKIDVMIHPQSIVHSMVEYVDGSLLAQLGVPDMRAPIAYALAYPDRLDGVVDRVGFETVRELTFFEPDHGRFPAIGLARKALELGDTYPAVLNGANEVAVRAFLERRIPLTEICRIGGHALAAHRETGKETLEDFLAADRRGREEAERYISKRRAA